MALTIGAAGEPARHQPPLVAVVVVATGRQNDDNAKHRENGHQRRPNHNENIRSFVHFSNQYTKQALDCKSGMEREAGKKGRPNNGMEQT